MPEEDDYQKFRGKCHEMSKALCDADPDLELVQGHYNCFYWGLQPHWWCVRKSTDEIIDPTVRQFPSGKIKGAVNNDCYVPFDGWITCEECGKSVQEGDAYIDGHHTFCSGECFGRHVGLI